MPPIEKLPTVAEGIASAQPVRGHEMLEALRGSNGVVQTVTEEEIWGALEILWRTETVGADESVVLYLTGSGLKSTETIARHFAGRF